MQPGTCLGDRYTLEELIGTGEHTSVWSGRDLVRDRLVRVKALAPELSRDDAIRERFRRSALRVAPLTIPGIVDVGDCVELTDEGDTIVCQIAELPEGEPLSRALREHGTLELDKVLFTVSDAAWALQEAHDEGVRHHNLKPANLIVAADGSVTIVDFGFAPPPEPGDRARPYTAPELLRGEDAGATADVFSLGVIAYECLTGAKPFDADSTSQLAAVHREHQPVPLPAGIPRAAAALIMKSLSPTPDERFASAADLALECRQINFTNDVLGALLEREEPGPRPDAAPEPTQPVTRPTSAETTGRDDRPAAAPDHDQRPQVATPTPSVELPIVPEPRVPSGTGTATASKPAHDTRSTAALRASATPPPARPGRSRRRRVSWLAALVVLVLAAAAAVLAATFLPNGPSGSAADGRESHGDGALDPSSTSSVTPGPGQSADDSSSGDASDGSSTTDESASDPSESDSDSDSGSGSDEPDEPDEPDDPEHVEVPDVVGDDRHKATDQLRDADLKVNLIMTGEGRFECNVHDQAPNSGENVPPGTTVDIEVKRAEEAEDCERGVGTESPSPSS